MFILFFTVLAGSVITTSTAEFSSKKACVDAAQKHEEQIREISSTSTVIVWRCAPK
jgi:hypothetical protein